MQTQQEEISNLANMCTGSMLSFAFSKIKDKEAAKEVVQNTFLAAVENYHSFRKESELKTWVFGIMHHKIADYARRKVIFKEVDVSIFKKHSGENEAFLVDEDLLESARFKTILYRCIEDLPERWREAITLKYIQNKSSKFICDCLQISVQNYWQILHRAKVTLKKSLNQKWFNNHNLN